MSFRKSLGKLLVLMVLQIGAVFGVPMTADQINKLMNLMHRTKVEYTVRNETNDP